MEQKNKIKKVPVEVYSRVVGYFRPLNQWNKGKREEFAERKEFTISEIQSSLDKQRS
jgi:anaerobic ribonucleoside-triphosphate reductase